MSEKKSKEEVLAVALEKYFDNDRVLAKLALQSIKKELDRLEKEKLFCAPRIISLKKEIRMIGVHSPFSYVEECLLFDREIDKKRVVSFFAEKEKLSSFLTADRMKVVVEERDFKDFFQILIECVEVYLRWYSIGGEENKFSSELEKIEEEREALYWPMRNLIAGR